MRSETGTCQLSSGHVSPAQHLKSLHLYKTIPTHERDQRLEVPVRRRRIFSSTFGDASYWNCTQHSKFPKMLGPPSWAPGPCKIPLSPTSSCINYVVSPPHSRPLGNSLQQKTCGRLLDQADDQISPRSSSPQHLLTKCWRFAKQVWELRACAADPTLDVFSFTGMG